MVRGIFGSVLEREELLEKPDGGRKRSEANMLTLSSEHWRIYVKSLYQNIFFRLISASESLKPGFEKKRLI